MHALRLGGLAAAFALCVSAAKAAPVLMISIDGLRPADVLEADKRGLKLPTLSALVAEGAYATNVINVLPTVTYPNHTTLITGVRPALHGIPNNVVFDPLRKNMDGWYWYASDIKVPTLWDQVHAKGGVVASIGWPVSVGAHAIDDNIPEYWRARTPDDVKLIRALATPGLPEALEAASGQPLAGLADTTPDADEAKSRFAVVMYRLKQPRLFTLHLSSLDEVQHIFGPDTPEAHAALERIDADIGRILAAARQAEPDLMVAIVSDHGFAPVTKEVNLYRPFIDAGLITVDPKSGKPTAWLAEPWGGASAAIVLAHPDDEALKARVKALLDKLAADPELGINRIVGREGIARLGATPLASFYVDFKIGYEMGQKFDAPPVSPSPIKGMHGYFPDHPEMHATFVIAGPSLTRKGSLGDIDMWRIAPTVAEILQVDLPQAEGKPLF